MSKKMLYVIGPFNRKVGIITTDYEDLYEKASIKFLSKLKQDFIFTLEDGTEIDKDFYEVIENKSTLLFVKKQLSNCLIPFFMQLQEFLVQYVEENCSVGDKLENVLLSRNRNELIDWFKDIPIISKNCNISSIYDDPEWFNGLDTKFKTKEDVMRNSAETRMRSYLYKAKKSLETINNDQYNSTILYFKKKLKTNRYNAAYFDRRADKVMRLCTNEGLFTCFGFFNSPCCNLHHTINPYSSKEARILFSTWNLDHIIEKSRAIIPSLETCLRTPQNGKTINLDYFYEILFEHYDVTKKPKHNGNLKLVHIVCHSKAPHLLSCDKKRMYSEIE